MREIPLTQGKVAVVDDEDYEHLSQWKWYASGYRRQYAAHTLPSHVNILIHRIVMERMLGHAPPNDTDVDHIDGNPLNNTRANLRLATRSENMQNARPRSGSTSRYKGVSWDRGSQKWRARIHVESQEVWLGAFETEEDAAHAYDAAAREHFGEFARTNFGGGGGEQT